MSRLIDKVNELIASNMSRAEVLDRMEGFFEQAENDGERNEIRELFNPIFEAEQPKTTWTIYDKNNKMLSTEENEESALSKCNKDKGEYINVCFNHELIEDDF